MQGGALNWLWGERAGEGAERGLFPGSTVAAWGWGKPGRESPSGGCGDIDDDSCCALGRGHDRFFTDFSRQRVRCYTHFIDEETDSGVI